MDFMEILVVSLRSFLVVLASLMAVIYTAVQFFQRIPRASAQLATWEWVVLGVVTFLVGLGLNSYWGLLAFAPLILWRFIASYYFRPEKLGKAGRWFEIEWHKLTPKGLPAHQRAIAQESLDQLARIPKHSHFLIPRFAALWLVGYIMKRTEKDMKKLPEHLKGQQAQATSFFQEITKGIKELPPTEEHKWDVRVGVLRVKRT